MRPCQKIMSMVPCAALALPLTRLPRQSLPCAALAFPLTRQPRQSLPCADLALPLTRQPRQSHPVRRPGLPAHETASAVPPVRRLSLPAHEEDQNKAFVRERVTFAHGRIVEPFSVARKDCGTLTGCVMALLSLARGVPFVLADRNRR